MGDPMVFFSGDFFLGVEATKFFLQGNVVRCKSQICTGPTDTCCTTPMMICDHSNSGAKRQLPPVATLKVGG